MIGWIWLLGAALVASAYFAGSETALVSAGRLRHRAEKERGDRLAGLAERLYRRPEHTLSVLLIGNNAMAVLASICALMITEAVTARLNLSIAPFWSDLISSIWVAGLVLVCGEILPKSVAHHYALRISRQGAPLLLAFTILMHPVLWTLDGAVRLLRRLIGRRRVREETVSWETVRLHLEAARAAGALGAEQEVVIHRIGLLGSLSAGNLMVPLEQLDTYPAGESAEGLRRIFAERGSSRAFLTDPGGRRLQGMLLARHLLTAEANVDLRALMTPLLRVPVHAPVLDLIDELQPSGRKVAVVTDELDRSLGVVFLEDLLRQLVQFRRADSASKV